LLLLAAAHQTGLVTDLESGLASLAFPGSSRVAHLSSGSRQRLTLTLLFLGVVNVHRTWDLRSYTDDALGLLTGRKRAYGYFYTERFLAEVAKSNGAEVLTTILARWTARLWQFPPTGADTQALFYIDGHRKPV